MKKRKLISLLSAALIGICSAAVPSAVSADTTTIGFKLDGVLYSYSSETQDVLVYKYSGPSTVVNIPAVVTVPDLNIEAPVTRIYFSAFKEAPVTEVTVPASVTSINSKAFQGCSELTSLTILGPASLSNDCIADCESLERVQLSDSSASGRFFYSSIKNCPNLFEVNGVSALLYETDSSGREYPVINPAIRTAVLRHFSRSENVGFVDQYCTDICKYIVKTETSYDPDGPANQPDDWMSDALKVRQLHDWLIRHCEYEDCSGAETLDDQDNHVASSVFLSAALNIRGEGIGETVCDGFTKAYTMLLSTAGIESYFIGFPSHVWTLVKIDGVFYHSDVTIDNSYAGDLTHSPYKTNYVYFLKQSLHEGNIVQKRPTDHPLLLRYTADINAEIGNCPQNYPDSNGDGILDNDYDLDGTALGTDYWEDLLAYQQLCGQYGYNTNINDKLGEVLYRLNQQHHGFWG